MQCSNQQWQNYQCFSFLSGGGGGGGREGLPGWRPSAGISNEIHNPAPRDVGMFLGGQLKRVLLGVLCVGLSHGLSEGFPTFVSGLQLALEVRYLLQQLGFLVQGEGMPRCSTSALKMAFWQPQELHRVCQAFTQKGLPRVPQELGSRIIVSLRVSRASWKRRLSPPPAHAKRQPAMSV